MYERILVPTDGSEAALTAAECAAALARRFGAAVDVVHVPEQRERLFAPSEAEATAAAAEHVEETRAVVTEAGIEPTTAILDEPDQIHEVLARYVDDNDVDCIVMGTHGRTGFDRYVLGSVTERTIRTASVPVVTVHEETAMPAEAAFERLLVPTDGSESAMAAAEHAATFASAMDADIHVINAVDTTAAPGGVESAYITDELENAGEQAIERLGAHIESSGGTVTKSSVVHGSPYRAIVEYAEENDVDCIVMGTHGRTGLDRYLLGSVTERVVRLASVPVVTVHAPDQPV
ncbi:universal stress protein [Haloarchaeobius amylolyticus]|uniref:universal stress protein n=1 Tax=Haloarchaeobius amylolyticus TaxID=1198296 RepID=UPI0022722032|nr:universal stress protein [Haloarchaeobius amylolyticus]